MHRLLPVLTLVGLPALALAQRTSVIEREGGSPLAKDVTFPASKTLTYRLVYAVNVGPEKPDSVVPGFRSVANFIYVADANGVPRQNLKLAIVVWGSATHSLLRNEAYRAARNTDNASVALLRELHDAGVQVIVCGEALINRKLARADLLPFVKVAPTASMALATLAAEGYTVFRP